MDLRTNYLGMELKNPIVVSPSPLTENLDNMKKMEDAGAAAIVMHSLFEEQITFMSEDLNENLQQGTMSFSEALTFFPEEQDYKMGPDSYLEHIRKAKEMVNIPVIGSLNGVSVGGWQDIATKIEQAGADALELNVYYIPTNPEQDGPHVENLYLDLMREVKKAITIPVAVKIGPYFSSTANMVQKLDQAGADGLVMFNRFYQPDLDLDNLEVKPDLTLSSSWELRLALRWVAILYSRIQADMAITGGVHTGTDALKAMTAGAKVAMMTSAILRKGIDHINTVLAEMTQWMEAHEYESIAQMQGSLSQRNCPNPAAFERANYMKIITCYTPNA
ncbi:MAG TPA: dihydroorotate dehydrogenase-like protein [Candidatus Hydrogenedentes bacterium]|nr:MAG: NAD-dependent dihydropyrimidine dehydrogenase subunit PreA [Candidatus Hydrogenedentes bacterium ADurb.Bin170]HNZ48142.1 dihydroorotate dehydrogenase-like protein [Candidatus Hydrogenedentota bacterium]HOH43350.1 dihydroorotate dehydrogenase-like protein [Candidatus Hydrogenedentota bacterium]